MDFPQCGSLQIRFVERKFEDVIEVREHRSEIGSLTRQLLLGRRLAMRVAKITEVSILEKRRGR